MSGLTKAALFAMSGFIAISAASPAMAQFKDAEGNIHVQNLTPGASATVLSGELTRKVTANFCGLVTVSVPTGQTMPATVQVGADTITVATLPVQSVPRCVNSVLAEARPANFKDASGRVVVVAKTPGTQYDVVYTGLPATRTLTANACGFIRISNTASRPVPTSFTYNGTTYTTATLPTQNPGLCRSGVKYLPAP
jgi:hypothetical protein